MKPGDIYQLGDHRLACGDGTDGQLVAKLIGADQVRLILSDPPYGVAYVESKTSLVKNMAHAVIQNDQNQSAEQYEAFTKAWLDVVVPHLTSPKRMLVTSSTQIRCCLHYGMGC